MVLAEVGQRQVALNIDIRRTVEAAGAKAVGVVIGDYQFKAGFARIEHFLRARLDFHAVPRFGSAGRQQLCHSLNFHDAKETGAERFEFLVVAEGWDII